ncbi:MAG: DUF4197 domain-containing protein [Dissulfurispiraceae bacterium]|jgi:uncharacterized protein with LGFP repeats|nr:DUF4197 domain-containing protein [Dissulfurispiraceae bacterium]
MIKILFACLAAGLLLILLSSAPEASFLDNLLKGSVTGQQKNTQHDEGTIASGLREALSVGTQRAVSNVSLTDGYFKNQAIKILMPEKIQKVADVMKKVGYQKQVDEFILSMNRAAESAAPAAKSIFVDAIRQMSIEDAKKIFNGGENAATNFFREKTYDRLYNAFKPTVSDSMNRVGTTKSYKAMISKYESVPFMNKESMDLDNYVTNKSLDGLFYMIAQEEKKIRTDPVARTTDLLKKVFGSTK